LAGRPTGNGAAVEWKGTALGEGLAQRIVLVGELSGGSDGWDRVSPCWAAGIVLGANNQSKVSWKAPHLFPRPSGSTSSTTFSLSASGPSSRSPNEGVSLSEERLAAESLFILGQAVPGQPEAPSVLESTTSGNASGSPPGAASDSTPLAPGLGEREQNSYAPPLTTARAHSASSPASSLPPSFPPAEPSAAGKRKADVVGALPGKMRAVAEPLLPRIVTLVDVRNPHISPPGLALGLS
jgi:hypothetical protein